MTDELLSRAARALRDAHTGERQGSGFTRARIMNTVHRERRRRVLRWAVFSPIASLLLVGSAWAQSTGKWPVIWKAVTSVLVAAPSQDEDDSDRKGKALPPVSQRPGTPRALEDGPDEPENGEPAGNPTGAVEQPAPPEKAASEPPAADEPLPAPRAPRAPLRPPSKRRVAPAARPSEPAASSPPVENDAPLTPEPARDRELARFRAAHDLHFAGKTREAIQAYAEYLREFPNGRFVPEARYNGALDHIKLGNEAAAREALAPFAAGRFGGYRQKEARELLEALER